MLAILLHGHAVLQLVIYQFVTTWELVDKDICEQLYKQFLPVNIFCCVLQGELVDRSAPGNSIMERTADAQLHSFLFLLV